MIALLAVILALLAGCTAREYPIVFTGPSACTMDVREDGTLEIVCRCAP